MDIAPYISKLNRIAERCTLFSGYALCSLAVIACVASVAQRFFAVFPLIKGVFLFHAGSSAIGYGIHSIQKFYVEKKNDLVDQIVLHGAFLGAFALIAYLISKIAPGLLGTLCRGLAWSALGILSIPSLGYTLEDLSWTLSGKWKQSELLQPS